MDIFAAGTGALLVMVFELTFRASQSAHGKLPFPPLVLGAYGMFVVGWIVAFVRVFRVRYLISGPRAGVSLRERRPS
jgi:hypothetical protein